MKTLVQLAARNEVDLGSNSFTSVFHGKNSKTLATRRKQIVNETIRDLTYNIFLIILKKYYIDL